MASPAPSGLAGRLAALFIESKLTPLIILGSLLLGTFAVVATPREEEPQIVVPMADVFIPFPGAAAKVVEEQLTKPLERKLSEIRSIEYVYSISRSGGALIIVRFYVGEPMEQSLVDLYDKLMSNQDLFPPGAGPFMVKPRDVNDVPIVTLTLSSERYPDYQLRQLAEYVLEETKKVPGTAGGFIVGGRQRELEVRIDPARLKAYGLTPLQVAAAIQGENVARSAGRFESLNREFLVETGRFIRSREDLEALVVGVSEQRPIYLRQIADVTDGPGEATSYVWFGLGPSGAGHASAGLAGDAATRRVGDTAPPAPRESPAVTVAIAKQARTNAVTVAQAVIRKAENLKGTLLPADVRLTVTRNYGETADEKADELLRHLGIAVVSVVLFLGLALGPRPAMVVSIAIPLTLALTLFVSMLLGYTINRVTLFALIFSIGILVDDAIVVVENMYRHLLLRLRPHREAALYAVDEVGNPTILATFTVIAALLPMAFVSGLMGPYMRPIPINASIAMFFSLLVAFVVIPWFCQKCYREDTGRGASGAGRAEEATSRSGPRSALRASRMYRFYRRLLAPLLAHPALAVAFLAGVALLLVASVSLFYTRAVVVKMLPFDNKSELQLVVDMPEGTTLEETARVTQALTRYVATVPEVRDYQAYVGTASPFNFNGLVRHYFLREGPHEADIQIALVPKGERRAQSHEIALRLRPRVQEIARAHGANVKVVEVPPGPPVLSVLVAEVYGPDYDRQIAVAKDVRRLFEATPGVVDVDDFVEADQVKYVFTVDRAKAALAGVPSEEVVRTIRMALEGERIGLVHIPKEKSPVQIVLRLPRAERAGLEHFGEIALRGASAASVAARSRPGGAEPGSGRLVPLSELLRIEQTVQDKAIHHKNQKPVVYVVGDVGGGTESPVYGVLDVGRRLEAYRPPEGYAIEQFYATQPWSEERLGVKWDGEWHITYETFRDMGFAFAVAMLLIYLLIVGEFQSFLTPVVIMVPIPLTLIGIVPGHWLTGSYFTATSMIGFIALAGIIVRNSILLVDFIESERRAGVPLEEAVVRAGAIRTRPILLTAAALMVGAFVIVLDPIFQGLAVSLLFGVGAATLLTLVVIPVLYVSVRRAPRRPAAPPADGAAPGRPEEPAPEPALADAGRRRRELHCGVSRQRGRRACGVLAPACRDSASGAAESLRWSHRIGLSGGPATGTEFAG
ncbi:efflux RND transporter permease subunit [Nitrospira sp. Kam-Ns4a]